MIIKCPCCGSTAQPKLYSSTETEKGLVTERYQCGCGATIERVFQRITDRCWGHTNTLIAVKKYNA